MDLMARKKVREKKRLESIKDKLESENLLRKVEKSDNPYSRVFVVIAIFVTVVVFGYLVYNSEILVKEGCGLMPGLNCENVRITGESISFEVHNLLKEAMNVTVQIENCPHIVTNYIRPNTKEDYVFNCGTAEKAVDRELRFTYVGYSELPHDKTGKLTGRAIE
ncbi:hypothetical protein ACFL3V_07440 [Nanoarchaeota archaeon]